MKDLFWEGRLDEIQEEELRHYILASDAEENEELKSYFLLMASESQSDNLDSEFDKQVLDLIDKTKIRKSFFTSGRMGIAASIVLIIGLVGLLNFYTPLQVAQNPTVVQVDTFDDPEKAYDEVKKALMLLSSNMNEGMHHTGVLGEFHKVQNSLKLQNK